MSTINSPSGYVGGYNSKVISARKRAAKKRAKARWARKSLASKAYAIAKRANRKVNMILPNRFKLLSWSRPPAAGMLYDEFDVVANPLYQNYQWVPIVGLLADSQQDTANEPGNGESIIEVLPRNVTDDFKSVEDTSLGSPTYQTIIGRVGDNSLDKYGGIWDYMFTAQVHNSSGTDRCNKQVTITPTVMQSVVRNFPTTCAISAPLNLLPKVEHGGSYLREMQPYCREGDDVYGMTIFLKYSIRICDAGEPDINHEQVKRANQPTNIVLMLVSIPIQTDNEGLDHTKLRGDLDQYYEASTIAYGPYQANSASDNDNARLFVQNMFKDDIMISYRRDNNALFRAALRPGAPRKDRGLEQGEKLTAMADQSLTVVPQHIEEYARGEPFKVLWRQHFRLGASDPNFMTNYPILIVTGKRDQFR